MKNASIVSNKLKVCDVPLSYPKFSEGFIINTIARKMKLRRVLKITWELRCFLLTQVNPDLINYITTVIKLLSMVENLKTISVPLY